MGFMNTYKRLDNLCRDMNSIGITGYINDMDEISNGSYHVFGWENDYQKLKHYRYIRNQIAHESYADEVNMCSDEDEEWLKKFHERILEQSDPLALYQKKITLQKRTNKSVGAKSSHMTVDMSANSDPLPLRQMEITSQQHIDKPVGAKSSHTTVDMPANSDPLPLHQMEITSQQHIDKPVSTDSSHKNTNNPSNSSEKRTGYAAIIFPVVIVLVVIFVIIALNIIYNFF